MPCFVFEIGFEEMPARFLGQLKTDIAQNFTALLERERIDCPALCAFATPRRLVLFAKDMAAAQRAQDEVMTGPPAKIAFDAEGKPTKAALGFAKGLGIAPEALYTLETEKGPYLAARKQSAGLPSLGILPALCEEVVKSLNFPKKMRWGSLDFTFGRPIRWILALLGPDIVPFSLAEVASDRLSFGHRVMGPGPFSLAQASDYLDALDGQGRVVADADKRKRIIREEAKALAQSVGGEPLIPESLLEEVCGLTEYPKVLLGAFDEKFLELPREVLLTSMQNHQKSFGVEDSRGEILPYFLSTAGLDPTKPDLVRKGWERVLRARLEDARFFWETDLSASFEDWRAKLEKVVFLGPLGSMAGKSLRLEKICARLAEQCAPAKLVELGLAARLAKADLVSEMVGEFAELQGQMGGIYAACKGQNEFVVQAIYEQYLPAGPESPVPPSLGGALLSLADKMDTLCGCFGLDMIPTGAADPYALRRQALGVCRIVLEHGLRLSLAGLADFCLDSYGEIAWKLGKPEAKAKLLDFFGQRLKAYFQGLGFETRVVEAALGAGFDDIWQLRARLEALAAFSGEPDFSQAVLTFKRAANIIRKQGAEAAKPLDARPRPELLLEPAERELAEKLNQSKARFEELWRENAYPELLGLLRELRPSVDAFFDNVMVICDDQDLRLNRLNLLKSLVDRLGRLADFAALQV